MLFVGVADKWEHSPNFLYLSPYCAKFCHINQLCVALNTLTMALTCHYRAVSATCWGSLTQLTHLLVNPPLLLLLKICSRITSNGSIGQFQNFTSAFLWGGLRCCVHPWNLSWCNQVFLCVAISTLTIALTCVYNVVSATCWGSFTWLILQFIACICFCATY